MRLPRRSGILLHLTSLPGPHGCGDLGPSARHFVDWLAAAGQKLWQILPTGPIGPGNSPYMSVSAFAGNPLLIDLAELGQQGWLTPEELEYPDPTPGRVDYARTWTFRLDRLQRAARRFLESRNAALAEDFAAFRVEHADWVEDYALFMAIEESHPGRLWSRWPEGLARREATALRDARARLAFRVDFWCFVQWRFFRQWAAVKRHAADAGVALFGDIPIFVAHHSAEVWSQPDLFDLGPDLEPRTVAGVPPDFYSATGQRWGNPLYRWDNMERDGFAWWIHRVRRAFDLVDVARVDHFRGFAGYWEIPADEPTAINGRWRPAPGRRLFAAVREALGHLPIVAEDLGVITDDVVALREEFELPGMRVLHFGFGGDPRHPFLPHNFERNTAVYTGTHDNDTTLGWYGTLAAHERTFLLDYLGAPAAGLPWSLMRAASASVADTVIFPMQDVLELGAESRMNLPGQSEGHWEWRFEWSQVAADRAEKLRDLARLYGRL
jgi:4-alpha-glucanotransferase